MVNYDIKSSYGCGNSQALTTMKEISEIHLDADEECVFSLKNFSENNPFNVLAIASSLYHFRQKYPHNNVVLRPKGDGDFLSHLGFYHMVGAEYGKKIGDAKPNSNYVPIRKVHLGASFYSEIEDYACDLARLLHFDKNLEEFIKYAFIEIIRNVYEHANIDTAFICAQKWPSQSLVEIAIIDNGCGIAHAMRRRFPNKNEKDLMYLAALPGVSALSNHRFLDRNDTWRNSGYGLYALRRLSVLYQGSFLLCSGNLALYQKQSGVEERDTFFPGTAVALHIRTDTENDFKSVRCKVIAEGEREAKDSKKAIKTASKSSGGKYND